MAWLTGLARGDDCRVGSRAFEGFLGGTWCTVQRTNTTAAPDTIQAGTQPSPTMPKEVLMRCLALALVASATMSLPGLAAAQTYAPGYPVCLHVYGPVSYYECRYNSLEQCNVSASGRAAQCVVNPYVASAEEPLARPSRRYRSAY